MDAKYLNSVNDSIFDEYIYNWMERMVERDKDFQIVKLSKRKKIKSERVKK